MIVGYLNLASLSDVTDRVKVGRQGYALMADQEGTIIAHPDRIRVSERQNMSHLEFIRQGKKPQEGNVTYLEDGKEYLASMSRVLRTQWAVIVVEPIDDAFALVTRVRTLFTMGALVVVLLAAAIAFISMRKIAKPVSEIIHNTNFAFYCNK